MAPWAESGTTWVSRYQKGTKSSINSRMLWRWQAKSVQRHLTLLQLSRCVGVHQDMLTSQRLELVDELCQHYDAGLQLGRLSLLQTHLVIQADQSVRQLSLNQSGFVQTMESPGIKMLRFPGMESPGKGHRSWKTLEKSWNSKEVVLKILISGTSITNLRGNSL